ncbi:hypothetical protein TREPR_0159 [Treponema primitia ZAS-2]|uniref:OB-fold nucleic acid binding domain protein n=1 Tax=Treponema primitia (strain ATCC BAA-887 / DSM 12427 / ZAS-2) TaxID=545694 RepID=F5YMG3_TREPZ|nr:hypothetical protein [Treponema primitia]AEF86248.1 hypothetical protein TREPR_0159 [Treponema primitia ZAS-2]
MKRMISMLAVMFCLAGTLFAQNQGPRGAGSREAPVTLTVSGTLELINGNIGLKEGDTTYYVFGLDRLIGFVDGLKEGAAVTLEGRAFPAPRQPNFKVLAVSKLSFNGKDYEGLAPFFGEFGPGFGPGTMPQGDTRNWGSSNRRPSTRSRREGWGQPWNRSGPHHRN